MTFDKQLLEVLACPDDKAKVKLITNKNHKPGLICTKCKRTFKINNGIPVMMPKEDRH